MKLKVLALTVTALCLLLSFSPWEGAAGVAPDGELPASGFFIATNSFPRNTVVDVTNLETGKTTRAIVANTLTNPGLLAIVSRDAANLIGMRSGSISRIRVLSPSDPIAYQRFTEGLAQEMPPFDSGNVIKSEQELLAEVYGHDPFVPGASTAQAAANAAGGEFKGPSYLMEPEWGGTARLEIVDIPRYNEPPASQVTQSPPPVQEPVQIVQPPPQVQEPPVQVVQPPTQVQPPVQVVIREPVIEMQEDVVKDVPSYIAEQSAQDTNKQTEGYYAEIAQGDLVKDVPAFAIDSPYNAIVKDVPEYFFDSSYSEIAKNVEGFISEEAPGNIAKDVPGYIPDSHVYHAAVKDVPEFVADTLHTSIAKDVPAYISESQSSEIAKSVEGFISEEPIDGIAKDVERFASENLAGGAVKDVERFISPQSNEAIAKHLESFYPERSAEEIAKYLEGFNSERYSEELVKYLEGFYPERTSEEIAKAVSRFEETRIVEREPERFNEITPEYNIVEAGERKPDPNAPFYGINPNDIIPGISSSVTERPAVVPSPTAEQSFSIRSISALDRGQYYVQIVSIPENLVESTIRQFDPQFFSYNPVVFRDRDNSYRILIGPLNQGESAAILARFKSIGYRDAFVRRGG